MSKLIMVTNAFELTNDMVEIKELSMSSLCYDERLNMVIPLMTESQVANNFEILIKNYVESFCALTMEHINSKAGTMVSNGFLPVGIEPLFMRNALNPAIIIPELEERGIPYYQIKATSPIDSRYEMRSEASMHDIWVNKLDAATIVNKKPHQITALDLLEELLP